MGTNFSEILIKIQNFSFTKIHLKMPSAKWCPFCPARGVTLGRALTLQKRRNRTSSWYFPHLLYNPSWLPTYLITLQWRHNERDSVSNQQPCDCLFNCLFRRRSKETSNLRVTGLCAGNSTHKGPVTREMFSFDDVSWRFWKRTNYNLILTVLNFSEGTKTDIHILWHCSTLTWHR